MSELIPPIPAEATTAVAEVSPSAAPPLDAVPPGDEAVAAENQTLPSPEEIREALKEVIDPELGINIVDLGLIYDVMPNDESRVVDVNMTLTSPGCPAGPELTSAVWMTVKRMPGVKDCEVKLIWSPRWDPQVHASEEARMYLGLW